MTPIPVSVVVVSRARPQALRRCLLGLSQMRYDPFEVVVVADAEARSVLRGMPQAGYAKIIPFDRANISEARNLGIAHADGDVVAFLDDDAVPEPSWLSQLIPPFRLREVSAAGGFVRGRNGISWQWRAETVDRTGTARAIKINRKKPTLLTATRDQGVKTQGTNMAVRRKTLSAMGGFDPNFRYYLDETDLNMRLAAELAVTAMVPQAEVHHGYLANAMRRSDRAPTDLTEIGASWAVFLRKHCESNRHAGIWRRIVASERKRLLRHMQAGTLEPRDVDRLLGGLYDGYDAGKARAPSKLQTLTTEGGGFRPFPVSRSESVVFAGRSWQRRSLHRKAIAQVSTGRIVTVLKFSPTLRYHEVTFRDDGYWEQSGGLFGKSVRTQRLFRLWGFRARVQAEKNRVSAARLLD